MSNATFHESQANLDGTQHPADIECEQLHQQVSHLADQLGWAKAKAICEENRRIQSEQQLYETRQQLERQKTLKEMFINRGKETKAELERLERCSDPETLSAARIATLVRNRIRRTKKKELQVDFEELQVAYIKSQEKFEAILQAERAKSSHLEVELEKVKASHQEICQRYEAEIVTVRQQAETVQQNFEKEIKKMAVLQRQYEELDKVFALSQKLFTAELEMHTNKSKCLQEELEKVTISCQEMKNYEADVKTARQQANTLQQELEKEREAHKATIAEACMTINSMNAQQEHRCQELGQQISILKQSAFEKEKSYEKQFEDLKAQLSSQILLNHDLSAKSTQQCQRSIVNVLAIKHLKDAQMSEDEPITPEGPIPAEPTVAPAEQAEAPEHKFPEGTNSPSLWKNTCEEKSTEPCQQSNVSVLAIEHLNDAQMSEDEPITPAGPIPAEPGITPAEQAEAPVDKVPQATNAPSFWKRTRHFLGLRKLQRWRKKKDKDTE